MAGFITIGAIDIEMTEFRSLTPAGVGEVTRAYDRTLRSTRQPTTKGEWSGVSRPYTVSDLATIRTACAFGTVIAVGGSAFGFSGAGTINVIFEEGDSEYVLDPSDATYGYQRPLTLTVHEV